MANGDEAPGLGQEVGTISPSKLLREEFQADREALRTQVEPLIRDVFHTALTCLEEALPEHDKPGTADHKLFQGMRHRILNTGNQKLRELPKILECFAMRQVIKREVVCTVVAQGHGPFNLPKGVKMPSERNQQG